MIPSNFEHTLEQFADLALRVALNLQPGQRLLIRAPPETARLVRLFTAKAYEAGARLVDVLWDDPSLLLARLKFAPRDSLEEFPSWLSDATWDYVRHQDGFLRIVSDDPNLLLGQDPELIALTQKTWLKHMRPTVDALQRFATNWLGISAPSAGWAAQVFPNDSPEQREAKLWATIFEICRLNEADPIGAWKEHLSQLAGRSKYLTEQHYKALKLLAPGTDLTLGLPRGHIWRGGRQASASGLEFLPNLPTEEVFTTPHKDKTDGVVMTTKPAILGGMLIEGIRLSFENGRVVKASAEKGEGSLRKVLETDEGANRLGELALVPQSSPVARSGILFYNGLLDENAGNHIALGRGFESCLDNGETMSEDEFVTAGGNLSLAHFDLTVGSNGMDVDGIKADGRVEPIMRSGEWAFALP